MDDIAKQRRPSSDLIIYPNNTYHFNILQTRDLVSLTMTPIFVLAALLAFSPHRRPMIRPVDGISHIDGRGGAIAMFGIRRERRRRCGGISTSASPGGGASSSASSTASSTAAAAADLDRARRGDSDRPVAARGGCPYVVATVIAGTTRLRRRGSLGDRGISVIDVGNVGGSGNGNGSGRDYYHDHDDDDDNDDENDDEAYYQDGTGTNNKNNNNQHRHHRQQQQKQQQQKQKQQQQHLKSPHYSPPNIKLIPQPRKKELWLPWPLGAMRSDYYRFAETEVQRRRKQQQQQQQQRRRRRGGGGIGGGGEGGARSWHPPSGGGGGGGGAALLVDAREEWRHRLERGRGWATDILQRGAGGPMMAQRFPAAGGTTDGGGGGANDIVIGGGGGGGGGGGIIPRNNDGASSSSSSSSRPGGSKSAHRGARGAAIASPVASGASWPPWTKKDGNGGGGGGGGGGGKIARSGGGAAGTIVATDERRSTTMRGGEGAGGGSPDDDGGGGGGGGTGGGGTGGLDRDVLLRYLRLQASVRMRQLGYVGSDFSVHLPPASPVLLFYFALPSRQDPMRRLVRYAVAGATLSWMHAECTKYRRFSPLPGMRGVNVRRPDLPPFLPPVEEGWGSGPGSIGGGDGGDGGGTMEKTVPAKMMAASSNGKVGETLRQRGGKMGGSDATVIITPREVPPSSGEAKAAKSSSTTKEIRNDDVGGEGREGTGGEGDNDNGLHHPMWDPFQSFGSVSSIYRTWLEGNNVRAMRSAELRRSQASDQLLALRKMTTSSSAATNNSTSSVSSSPSSSVFPPPPTGGVNNAADNVGYALVTGASSGIGRALRYASHRGP